MNKITNCCLYEISLAGRVQLDISLKEKLHTYARACIVLHLIIYSSNGKCTSSLHRVSIKHCHEGVGRGGEGEGRWFCQQVVIF